MKIAGLTFKGITLKIKCEVMGMEIRLADLYPLADQELHGQIYLQDLSEQCANLEGKVIGIMDRLSSYDRQILETYIDLRNELEYQSVRIAIKLADRRIGSL